MAGSWLRIIRSVAHHDRRALKEEAERNPDGLARWAHATESWWHGEIAEARRSAEIDLQAHPDDFHLIRICLDYYIRARDSAQIYAYSKRLLAAKSPAIWARRLYLLESVLLWPIVLLGYKGVDGVKAGADNCDRWVAWAENYVTKHFKQVVSIRDSEGAPIEPSAISVTARTLRKHAWMATSIEVSVGGHQILTTGELKSVEGLSTQEFVCGGESHQVVLTWGKRSLDSIPYTLEIDGFVAKTCRVRISRWWAQYWPFAATLAVILLWRILIVIA